MMKKIYYIKCNKYRKVKNTKISHVFYETLALFVICEKRDSKDERIFKEGDETIFKEEESKRY